MSRQAPRYRPRLEIDTDTGVVTLVDPGSDPDDDATYIRLGHVTEAEDVCPDDLQRDLAVMYRDWVEEMGGSGNGCRELRRLYREGAIR